MPTDHTVTKTDGSGNMNKATSATQIDRSLIDHTAADADGSSGEEGNTEMDNENTSPNRKTRQRKVYPPATRASERIRGQSSSAMTANVETEEITQVITDESSAQQVQKNPV